MKKVSICFITLLLFICSCQTSKDSLEENGTMTLITSISLPMYTLNDLLDNSQYIIIGTCTSVSEAKYAKTRDPMTGQECDSICTDFEIEVLEVLKGELETDTVFIRSDIGKVDNFEYVCSEQVTFTDGEKALLFINKDDLDDTDCYRTTFFICGKYTPDNESYYNDYSKSSLKISDIEALISK